MQEKPSNSRRLSWRVRTPDGVWISWSCDGRDDVSRVRDLSLEGVFIETSKPRPVGVTAKLDLLVHEGQVRAEAVVRRIEPGCGLGLKFTAISDEDRPRLAALMTRIRSLSRLPEEPER